MSGLLNQILQAGGGQAVNMIAGRFGLNPSQAQSAIEALTPMIAGGFKNQANQTGGLENILGSVLGANHVAVGDDPTELARPGTTAQGNDILGQIFGSKDVSRQVAQQASGQTGISADILKQILPVLAMMAAGSMASKANAGGLGGLLGAAMGNGAGANQGGGMLGNVLGAVMGGGQSGASGALGGLASMIDMDKDGNPLDDILGMLRR